MLLTLGPASNVYAFQYACERSGKDNTSATKYPVQAFWQANTVGCSGGIAVHFVHSWILNLPFFEFFYCRTSPFNAEPAPTPTHYSKEELKTLAMVFKKSGKAICVVHRFVHTPPGY